MIMQNVTQDVDSISFKLNKLIPNFVNLQARVHLLIIAQHTFRKGLDSCLGPYSLFPLNHLMNSNIIICEHTTQAKKKIQMHIYKQNNYLYLY